MLLNEAAKNAQDLKNFYDENWMEHNNMIRALWKKYGMWKLGKMMNIGIPDEVQTNWRRYTQPQKDGYTRSVWQLMIKQKPPTPVIIVSSPGSDEVEVSYGAIFPKMGEPAKLLKFDSGVNKKAGGRLMQKVAPMESMPGGSITFYKPNPARYGECNNAFVVANMHQTTDGWGPLLYDVAMEVSSIIGGGLTSSRNMVSSFAKPVWDYYDKRRSSPSDPKSDVKKSQLDIEKSDAQSFGLDQLTPKDPTDDCMQAAAVKWASGDDYGAWEKRSAKSIWDKIGKMSDEEKKQIPWTDESVSKSYKKDPDIIKFLGEAGLLHAPDLGYDAINFHTSDLPPLPPMEDDDLGDEPPPEKKSLKDKIINQAMYGRGGIMEGKKLKVKIV